MIALLNRIDRALARAEYFALVLLMAALTLVLVAQVVCRYFFGSPIFWAEEAAVQMLTLASCLGVSYLIYSKDMIKVDFLLSVLPEYAAAAMQRAVYLVGFLTLAFIGFHAAEWLLRPENALAVSPTTGLPKWYNYCGIAVSFLLMAWHLLVKLVSPVASEHSFMEDGTC